MSPVDFARVFNKEDFGQLIVYLDDTADTPGFQFLFFPPGFGVCSASLPINGSDAVWDEAERRLRSESFEDEAWGFLGDALEAAGLKEAMPL